MISTKKLESTLPADEPHGSQRGRERNIYILESPATSIKRLKNTSPVNPKDEEDRHIHGLKNDKSAMQFSDAGGAEGSRLLLLAGKNCHDRGVAIKILATMIKAYFVAVSQPLM